MKRFLFLFVCCIAIISALVVSSFAASYDLIDYNDYVTDVKVDGDNDLVTITLPGDLSLIEVVRGDTWQYVLRSQQSASFNPIVGVPYYVNLQMLSSSKFDLSLFPDDTRVEYNYTITSGSTNTFTVIPSNYIFTQYFDINGNYLTQNVVTLPYIDDDLYISGTYSASTILTKPTNAASFSGYLSFEGLKFANSSTISFSLDSVKLTFSISSLYRQQQLTGKTNELLEDIAGYVPDVDTPEGGEAVGDVGDIESGLIEDVSGGLDELGSTMEGTLAVLGKYANSLFAVAWLMGKVFEISEFNDLVSVSLGLSVIVLLFSVSLTVSSSISRRSRSSGSKASGKGGGKK